MPSLWLANTSKKHHVFMYRIPGHERVYKVEIDAGSQAELPHKNLGVEELDFIIKQHAQYGLIDQKEIPNMRAYSGMCYSIGKKIDMRRVVQAIEKNDVFLQKQSDAEHINNIVAADHVVRKVTGDKVRVDTMDIEEEVPKTERREPTGAKLKMGR